jgi:hypothetical protein
MKKLPKIGDIVYLVDPKLVDKPIKVKVAKHYCNGNFAATLGVVEQPLTYKSRVWEVNKESLEKDLTK